MVRAGHIGGLPLGCGQPGQWDLVLQASQAGALAPGDRGDGPLPGDVFGVVHHLQQR